MATTRLARVNWQLLPNLNTLFTYFICMFDDQPSVSTPVPQNLPVQPDDMFSSVDGGEPSEMPVIEKIPDALSSGMLKKKQNDQPANDMAAATSGVVVNYPTKAPILGTVLKVLLLLIIAGLVGFGGWWVYITYIHAPTTAQNQVNNSNTIVQTITSTEQQIINTLPLSTTSAQVIPAAVLDATTTPTVKNANDSLLFGAASSSIQVTSSNAVSIQPDADKDGLSDAREVNETKTNPLKSDTDGDNLSDGDEVLIWHTDPLKADTDGDGHPDGTEVANGYNPLGPGRLSVGASSTSKNKKP